MSLRLFIKIRANSTNFYRCVPRPVLEEFICNFWFISFWKHVCFSDSDGVDCVQGYSEFFMETAQENDSSQNWSRTTPRLVAFDVFSWPRYVIWAWLSLISMCWLCFQMSFVEKRQHAAKARVGRYFFGETKKSNKWQIKPGEDTRSCQAIVWDVATRCDRRTAADSSLSRSPMTRQWLFYDSQNDHF